MFAKEHIVGFIPFYVCWIFQCPQAFLYRVDHGQNNWYLPIVHNFYWIFDAYFVTFSFVTNLSNVYVISFSKIMPLNISNQLSVSICEGYRELLVEEVYPN